MLPSKLPYKIFNCFLTRVGILATTLLVSNITFTVAALDSLAGNTQNNSTLYKDLLNLSTKLEANIADGLVDQAISCSKSLEKRLSGI